MNREENILSLHEVALRLQKNGHLLNPLRAGKFRITFSAKLYATTNLLDAMVSDFAHRQAGAVSALKYATRLQALESQKLWLVTTLFKN